MYDFPDRAENFLMDKVIKAVIFDMDGVLIDAKEWHYEALNKSLNIFDIVYQDMTIWSYMMASQPNKN